MTNTANYNLKKPDGTDVVDISVINSNFDTIDTTIRGVANSIPSTLPANGGNSDTVDSLHASSFVRNDVTTATNQNISSIAVGGGNELWFRALSSWINYRSNNGTTNNPADLYVGNGQGTPLAKFSGSDNTIYTYNTMRPYGSIFPTYASWNNDGTHGDGDAGIVNDNSGYKSLVIVGNNSASSVVNDRRINMYDNVTVSNNLFVNNETTLPNDGSGLSFFNGPRIYKKISGGLKIKPENSGYTGIGFRDQADSKDIVFINDSQLLSTVQNYINANHALTINGWCDVSANDNGDALIGNNCYTDKTTGQIRYTNSHDALGARGILMVYGGGIYSFDTGSIATTANKQFTPTLNRIWDASSCPCALGANGYQKLANGMIIQWGQLYMTNYSENVVFPIAFSTTNIRIALNIVSSGVTSCNSPNHSTPSNTGFTINSYGGITMDWIAIGY